MMRNQSSLEYLIIIAAVLAIVAIVVLFLTGSFSVTKQGADISKCKQAAAKCSVEKATSPEATCDYCEQDCPDYLVEVCKQGAVENISINVSGGVSQPSEEQAVCGNGVVESGEVCDSDSVDCSTLGNYESGTLAPCLSDCSGYDTSVCTPLPENFIVNGGFDNGFDGWDSYSKIYLCPVSVDEGYAELFGGGCSACSAPCNANSNRLNQSVDLSRVVPEKRTQLVFSFDATFLDYLKLIDPLEGQDPVIYGSCGGQDNYTVKRLKTHVKLDYYNSSGFLGSTVFEFVPTDGSEIWINSFLNISDPNGCIDSEKHVFLYSDENKWNSYSFNLREVVPSSVDLSSVDSLMVSLSSYAVVSVNYKSGNITLMVDNVSLYLP